MDYFDNTNLKNPKGTIIYKALEKYGHANFNLKILEYCLVNDLMVREQYYLDTLKPDYNILTYAGSSRGYRHTEASKELMSSSRKEWSFSPDQLTNFSSDSYRNKPIQLTNTATGEIITAFKKIKNKISRLRRQRIYCARRSRAFYILKDLSFLVLRISFFFTPFNDESCGVLRCI